MKTMNGSTGTNGRGPAGAPAATAAVTATAEAQRLATHGPDWRRWGPYLAERAWATVREDYSADGSAWDYLPHDHARSRAYRWNEDGLLGLSDDQQRLCFALALWNGADPILKERLFGLTGTEGNHGEDVKEEYFYLDSTPTHSFMKALYKYPQGPFPYAELVETGRRRSRQEPEYELVDTGVFDGDRYFDVLVEYAKAAPDDVLIRISATNRGPEPAVLHLLPTLWFRNTWSWGRDPRRPILTAASVPDEAGVSVVRARHHELGAFDLHCEGADALLFTENETNAARLFGTPSASPHVKDAFHRHIVHGEAGAVNPAQTGTKAAAHYVRAVGPGETATVRLCLLPADPADGPPTPGAFAAFDRTFTRRQIEADAFYAALQPAGLDAERRRVQRQALAGMLWTKQFFYYDVEQWLEGDPGQPPPPPERKRGRNREWRTLNNADVLSVPDTWEYPWYATWDLAFHLVPLALVDPEFAKDQLILLLREWYQHPNGQVPAYEWAFSDVNPPVLAWAAWRVYKIDQKARAQRGRGGDVDFLERVFHKLLLNFTWWVNRKDAEGNNVFQGGFLGLDNIGVFDRSAALPTGGHIDQSDGTAWMAMFCLNLLTIALELASHNPVYEDVATKFFEHFMYIAGALNNLGGDGISLWDEDDEFFYDVLHLPDETHLPLRVRSLVGLMPLLAVETVEPALLDRLPDFKARLEWFLDNRPDLARLVSRWREPGMGERRLLALVRGHRMKRLLKRALDPDEFLSDFGIRSVSKAHAERPYMLHAGGMTHEVRYEPGESRSGLFGGNSNWRGPVWFPINYMLIEALQKFHHYYGDDFIVECPTGSGQYLTLDGIADFLSQRLIHLFLPDEDGRRPFAGEHDLLQGDPRWRHLVLFHEYFHGETGAGLGASHQTGWTGLVAKLIQQQGEKHGYEQDRAGWRGQRRDRAGRTAASGSGGGREAFSAG
ncbi:MAG TPA: glucosidase [Chloroflexota bacterium]|nr:glucosidase [Chloroflexota bacterium]